MTLRPMAAAPLVMAALFGWLGVRSANPWLQFLACAAGAPLVVAWFWRPRLDRLAFTWRAPYRTTVGESATHRIVATNRSDRPTPGVRLTHRVRGFADASLFVPALPPGGSAEITFVRPSTQRAHGRRHDLSVVCGAPLGLVERRRTWVLDSPFVVHPAVVAPVLDLGLGGEGEEPAGGPARTGTQPHATREWRPGDDRRHVHWRGTARHGRLVVTEPERALARRLALVVAGDAGSAQWEDLVSRAAWTVVEALRHGREVLLVAGASDPGTSGPQGGSGGAVAPWSGGADLVASDPVAALDWFSALSAPSTPTVEDVERAAGWVGPGADVVVATTSGLSAAGFGAAEPQWARLRPAAVVPGRLHGGSAPVPAGRVRPDGVRIVVLSAGGAR